MNIEDLPVHDKIKKILKAEGIEKLNPPQIEAIEKGLLDRKNLVISSPTASGKTLIAELAFLKNFLSNGKTVYLVPLKALGSEKFADFKKYESLGMKIALSLGDLDSSDKWLGSCDLIILSNEKMDSLLRHETKWIESVSLVIADEIHLIDEPSRGPTLEIILTRLKSLRTQILALSATIQNAEEIAQWLKADLVKSDYRPIELKKGVSYNDENSIVIDFHDDKKTVEFLDNNEISLCVDTIKKKKQALVFVSTRRSAEATAEKIGLNIKQFLKEAEKKELDKISNEIEKALHSPTRQCRKLASIVKNGAAFHHAGLVAKQRKIIEDNFKSGVIKFITATPTLCISGDTKLWHDAYETEVSNFDTSNSLFVLSEKKLINMKAGRVEKIRNSSKLIQISSVSGHSIKVTPNHKMLIKRKTQKMVLQARNIKKNDKIATIGKLNISKEANPLIKDFIIDNQVNISNHKFDRNLSYFIGAMLGDGYSGAETINGIIKYKGSPSIVGIDEEIFSHTAEICKNLDLNCRRGKNFYGTPVLVLGKNKWFREFLVRCGIEKKDKKYISEKLMNMSTENTASLLGGLFDTDGYVNKQLGPGFSNVSEKLIRQVQKLLLRLGIISNLRKRESKNMKIYEKEYKTLPCFELNIHQKKSILNFYTLVGFGVRRKQKNLIGLVSKINSNIKYSSCDNCRYKIYRDLFSGRTKEQKIWGKTKSEVIKILGEKGELGSRKINEIISSGSRKNDTRLNHHYELIKKRRIGNTSRTEWFWSLNPIGDWIFKNIIEKNRNLEEFFNLGKCPICNKQLNWIIKKGHRDTDFEEDIFWDKIRKIEKIEPEEYVYDVILPGRPKNDHMFVANGFIVHNSFGMNLPAWRVIVRDSKRFTGYGADFLPVIEMHQMFGRAGRPKYDSDGEAIITAKTENEAEFLKNRYIFSDPEPIYSKLSVERALRIHTLALIAAGVTKSKAELKDFFSKTFFAHQYGDIDEVMIKIEKILKQLEDFDFIKSNKEKFIDDFVPAFELNSDMEIKPTKIGKRVSELYLDPLSANWIISNLSVMKEMDFLMVLNRCDEMAPLLRIKKNEYEDMDELLASSNLKNIPDAWDIEYEDFLMAFKTSLVFMDWISESGEDKILDKYDFAPGELYNKITNADWLLYAAKELSILQGKKEVANNLNKLRLRVKYGVKEELIKLIMLKNIGRVRARALWKNGIKTPADIKKAGKEKLGRIMGPKIADSVLQQLN